MSRQRYLPYGAHRGGDDITATDRGFLGRTEDASTALDQVGARYYDPSLGRFISPDPEYDQTRPQSLNPYSYADGNPITLSDPSGLRVCDGNSPGGNFSCAPGQRPDGKDAPPPPSCWGWECKSPPPPAPKPRTGKDGLPIYHNDNGIGQLLFEFLLGSGGRDQHFDQYDPLTQLLLTSPTVRGWLRQIQVLLRAHGPGYAGHLDHADPKSNLFADISGALSHGLLGSHPADAFLGSYSVDWRTVSNGPHSAITYLSVHNKTDLNSVLHPEFTVSKLLTWASGGKTRIRVDSIDPPWRKGPLGETTQQFDFQVPTTYY